MASLELDSLVKRYGTVTALDGLSLEVRPGEIFGFVGSNGAGKTTAMRIVLGVAAADAGEVRWDGRAITGDSRRRIGYMPEERGLYPRMKVGEQLVYLARLHGMSTADARRSMETWTERLGVAGRRTDLVQALSLGNQQRVQLVAALIHAPAVLVLDEPFSGLDPIAVDVMSGVLRELADRGTPVLFSSHQLELVERICDRVGIVKQGRMAAIGSVEELCAGSPRRMAVAVAGSVPDPDWARRLAGVQVLSTDGGHTLVELDAGTDDQLLLQAALAHGPVHEFRPVRPGLAELYRHLVEQPAEETR